MKSNNAKVSVTVDVTGLTSKEAYDLRKKLSTMNTREVLKTLLGDEKDLATA